MVDIPQKFNESDAKYAERLLPHRDSEIARLRAEVERWKGIAEDTEALKQNYSAMLAKARNDALEEAAQIAWDNDAKAFRGRYDVDYKGRKRWDRLQLRSAENQCMNIIAEDTADAIRALKRPPS